MASKPNIIITRRFEPDRGRELEALAVLLRLARKKGGKGKPAVVAAGLGRGNHDDEIPRSKS